MNRQEDPSSISVVITAYNASKWIRRTIDTILSQTYPALEVIVVDDGSIDNTAEIVLSYGNNVKHVYQVNCGQPIARNRGIRLAKGGFIAFVDADDYWHIQKLEKQIDLIQSQGLAWVVSDAEWVDDKEEKIELSKLLMVEGNVFTNLLKGNFIISATPVVRREVFDQVGYFNEDPEARIGEDWDMWLRIASRYPLGVVREKLAYVRLHSYNMMSVTSMAEKVLGLEGVVLRAIDRQASELHVLKRDALASIYYWAGVELVKQNQYREARKYFFRELRYRPLKIESWVYLFMTITGAKISNLFISIKRFFWKQSGSS